MIPQVVKRQIGKVNLIDMNGSMTSLWVSRLKTQLEQAFHNLDGNPVVFNFRPISDLDTLGVKAFFSATLKRPHLSLLSGSHEVMDLFNHYPESKQFQIFDNEDDLVRTYGPELLDSKIKDSDHRGSLRLQTAISVKFSYQQDSEQKQCVGIISNLSKHGFYIEYIDILSVEQSLTQLSPYDIQVLDFVLTLPNGKTVRGQGKVLHWQLDQDQFGIGIQIESLNPHNEQRFSDFLQSQQEIVSQHQRGR